MSKIGVLLHEQKTLGAGPEALRMGLADAGYADPPWSEVPKSRKAPKEVRRLLDAGIDRLLVWGGDGTVRRCIDTLVKEDADVELAILPAGTANLLAKALGIPIDLDAALDVALHGLPRRIDVGVFNGETFAVMAGTGFDALMIRDADDGAKERLGRISYVKAAARHLGDHGRRGRRSASTASRGSRDERRACSSATSAGSSVASTSSPMPGPTTGCSTSGSSRPVAAPIGCVSGRGRCSATSTRRRSST